MIRVLHIVTIMNIGGLETMLMNYYRTIDRNKIQFDFLVHRKERGAYDDEIEALGGRIYRMMPIHPRYFFQYKKEMKQFFHSHKEYSIVHSHLDTLSTIPLRIAKQEDIPTRIAHCHTTEIRKDIKALFRAISKQYITKYATGLFACSKTAGNWLFGEKHQEQVYILQNAINLNNYKYSKIKADEIKLKLNLENKKVIGHVGSFSYPKNHKFIIEVFNYIYDKDKDTKLVLVGDGLLRAEIEKEIIKRKLSGAVILLGNRNDVPDLLQAFDTFIFPSHYEGLSLALIEAQASGLRILASDMVPSDNNVTGLIEHKSLNAGSELWAIKIQQLLNEQTSRKQSKKLSDCGYDVNRNVKFLEKFYLEHSID